MEEMMTTTIPQTESTSPKGFKSKKKIEKTRNITLYVILGLVSLIMVLPTVVMILSSLKTYEDYYSMDFHFLPKKWAFDNYARVFEANEHLFTWIGNTVLLVVSNTVLCTVATIFVAYAFAKFRSGLSEALFMVLLCTMMIPWAVTMIPSFIVWAKLNLVDTFFPLILPSVGGSAYYTFMFRQSMRGIPNEIMEAAEIDGANSTARLWQIIVPNIIPAIVTMVLFTAMGIWGDFLGPLIYLRSPTNYNISLGLNSLRDLNNIGGRTDMTMLLAASVLMAIPTIVLYYVGTKIFAKGISLQGGVKG